MIVILGGFISYGIISLQQNSFINASTSHSVNHYCGEQARCISESMASMILSRLADSSSWRCTTPVSQNYFNGTTSYTVSDTCIAPDSLIKVKINSQFSGSTNSITLYVMNNKPPSLPYSLLGGTMIHMHDDNFVGYYKDSTKNSDLHSNGGVNIDSSNNIQGFVRYTDTSTVVVDSAQWRDVHPPQNPNNLPNHLAENSVTIPHFNPTNYKDMADAVYTTDQTLSGIVNLGTKTRPKVIYYEQNLTINSGTLINGYGYIIVGGSVNINNNVAMNQNSSNVYLYSNSDINIHDGNTLAMHIFTNGNFNADDSNTVYGNVVAGQQLVLSRDSNKIYYIPPSDSLFNNISASGYGFGKGRIGIKYWYE